MSGLLSDTICDRFGSWNLIEDNLLAGRRQVLKPVTNKNLPPCYPGHPSSSRSSYHYWHPVDFVVRSACWDVVPHHRILATATNNSSGKQFFLESRKDKRLGRNWHTGGPTEPGPPGHRLCEGPWRLMCGIGDIVLFGLDMWGGPKGVCGWMGIWPRICIFGVWDCGGACWEDCCCCCCAALYWPICICGGPPCSRLPGGVSRFIGLMPGNARVESIFKDTPCILAWKDQRDHIKQAFRLSEIKTTYVVLWCGWHPHWSRSRVPCILRRQTLRTNQT